jgi:hypothetical protein
MAGALMTELSGDRTLVGLLIDLTQEFDVVAQAFDHTGLPYGFGHVLVIDWMMLPVNPAWHDSVCVCVLIWHVGGFHTQVSLVSCHAPQTDWPYGSEQVLWRVYVLLPLWFWPQASCLVSLLAWQVGAGGV